MKRLFILLGLAVFLLGLVLVLTRPGRVQDDALPEHIADTSNGERLFHAGGCASCHESATSESSLPVLGGGLAMETPFGTFLVPNISPHPEHGIGNWTLLDFVNAMYEGTSPDGRHYYPAFPYASYVRMPFEDLADLKAYLDTLPVAEDRNREHALKFPWSIRAGIGLWKLINLDSSAVIPVPDDDESLMLGRYLVEGPGHCGECHTPRNWSGGLNKSRWLSGAPNPEGEGRVPGITANGKSLEDWSQGDIAYYLESGFTPDFDTVGSSMVKVQENMARLSKADRAAIAAYIKFVPSEK